MLIYNCSMGCGDNNVTIDVCAEDISILVQYDPHHLNDITIRQTSTARQ
jgi:hypothetical protein